MKLQQTPVITVVLLSCCKDGTRLQHKLERLQEQHSHLEPITFLHYQAETGFLLVPSMTHRPVARVSPQRVHSQSAAGGGVSALHALLVFNWNVVQLWSDQKTASSTFTSWLRLCFQFSNCSSSFLQIWAFYRTLNLSLSVQLWSTKREVNSLLFFFFAVEKRLNVMSFVFEQSQFIDGASKWPVQPLYYTIDYSAGGKHFHPSLLIYLSRFRVWVEPVAGVLRRRRGHILDCWQVFVQAVLQVLGLWAEPEYCRVGLGIRPETFTLQFLLSLYR